MKRYHDLFRLALRHTFFREDLARDLHLAPFAATVALARRYDLRWALKGNVLEVCYGQESHRQSPLAYLGEPASLHFTLRCSNPYFQNITALPEHGDDRILYFSNAGKPVADASTPIALNVSDFAGSADLLPLHGQVFELAPEPGDIQALLDSRGRKVAVPTTEQPPPREDLAVRLRADGLREIVLPSWLEAGQYSLDTVAGEPYRFFYGQREGQSGDLAVIEIRLGREGAPIVRTPTGEAPVQPVDFQLYFQALSTNWRWHLLPQTVQGIEPVGLEVVDQQSSRTLAIEIGQTPVPLRSGKGMALPVWLKDPVALREQPGLAPQLRLPTGGNGSGKAAGTLVANLPTPDPYRNLVTDPEAARIYSDMYVYL
jgi:hypothetical protein